MLKRPINSRFVDAVLSGIKTTTIRDTDWPVGVPIMLYNWSGKPYRSKQINVAPIIVEDTYRVWINHAADGKISYSHGQLWVTEGFGSGDEMDDWFRAVVPVGQDVPKRMMRFRLANND